MKIKAVVSDWDGVLYDSASRYFECFNAVLVEFGLSLFPSDAFRSWLSGLTAESTFLKAGLKEADLPEAKRRFIELTRQEPMPKVFPDTMDTLRWLHDRNIALFIVSAHPTDDIRRILETCEVTHMVTELRGNLSFGGKIAFLKEVRRTRNIAPNEIVFVDDMDEPIARAREASVITVASARGYCSYARLLAAQPDRIIHDLFSLQRFLNLLNSENISPPPGNGT